MPRENDELEVPVLSFHLWLLSRPSFEKTCWYEVFFSASRFSMFLK